MSSSYSPRVQRFREEILRELPRVPNNRGSRESLRAMPMHTLILSFVTWRMRLIPRKARAVKIWAGGVTPMQFRVAKPELRPLLQDVSAGNDLTPYLSDLVKTTGIVLPDARAAGQRQDIDMVLTRHGLHHFHVGARTPNNPKGRSGSLVFAEVLADEFRIVAMSDHRAFQHGTTERLRFFEICLSYMAKDVPPGQGFLPNPVMASGHSMLVTMFADTCDEEIRRRDALLDDPAYIDELYKNEQIVRDGKPIARPKIPSLTWHFEDLTFGILDKKTMVFFCFFPFFAR